MSLATIFVLGPGYAGHFEPFPSATPTVGPVLPGRRTISFRKPATEPGGLVHLQLQPPIDPGDSLPLNVYAFFTPASVIEGLAEGTLTPDYLFKSGVPTSSIHIGVADPVTGNFDIAVSGVKPSLDPYQVQTVLEFQPQ